MDHTPVRPRQAAAKDGMADCNAAGPAAPVRIALVSCHGCGVVETAGLAADFGKRYLVGQSLVLAAALAILVLLVAVSL